MYATNSLENLQLTVTNEERKILGVCWNHQSDQLIFNIHYVLKEAMELTPTKRTVVSVATRFYDPLGILSPVTIQFKILFQQTCKEGLDWDDPLTGDLPDQWNCIISDEVTPLVIPRYYFRGIGIGDKSYRVQ